MQCYFCFELDVALGLPDCWLLGDTYLLNHTKMAVLGTANPNLCGRALGVVWLDIAEKGEKAHLLSVGIAKTFTI